VSKYQTNLFTKREKHKKRKPGSASGINMDHQA